MKGFLRRYAQNYGAVVGLVIVLFVVLIAVFASVIYSQSPWMMVAQPLIAPFTDAAHPLGTDMLGRDTLAGIVFGARVSILVGLVSTAIALLMGIIVGAVAGFYGGFIDDLLMRFTELFQTIPQLALAIVL